MPDTPPQTPNTDLSPSPFLATAKGHVLSGCGFGVGAVLWAGLILSVKSDSTSVALVALLVSPALGLAMWGFGLVLVGAIRWATTGATSLRPSANNAELMPLLKSINQRSILSETARRINSRQEDMVLLRRTIQEDIQARNFDSAIALIRELTDNYGHIEEAEEYREAVEEARSEEKETKVAVAIEQLDALLASHDYNNGVLQARKIQRIYPDSPRTRDLMEHVMQSMEAYKVQLKREFQDAAQHEDIDHAWELLSSLDKYLTPSEAEPLTELARDVIHKKKGNLGIQFKLAAKDQEWSTAVKVGEQIIEEFPNSRMAEDVRANIQVLRERAISANQATPAQAAAAPTANTPPATEPAKPAEESTPPPTPPTPSE